MKRILVVLLLAGCSTAPEPRAPGRSVEGRTIPIHEFGDGPEVTLIFGGFHGDEEIAIRVAEKFCDELRWQKLDGRRVVVVPCLNPDGRARKSRQNANGVDLNRNFPTKDWGGAKRPGEEPASEPETRLAMRLVRELRPSKILSIHSPYRVNNWDGPQSRALAEAMAEQNGYPAKGSIGYPTPGSFGTWAGVELGIPMVTLEIPPGDFLERWIENKYALLAAVRHKSTRE